MVSKILVAGDWDMDRIRKEAARPEPAVKGPDELTGRFRQLPRKVQERLIELSTKPEDVIKAAELFARRLEGKKPAEIIEAAQFIEIYGDILNYMWTGELYKKLVHGTRGILTKLEGELTYIESVLKGKVTLPDAADVNNLGDAVREIRKVNNELVDVFNSLDTILYSGDQKTSRVDKEKLGEICSRAIKFSEYTVQVPKNQSVYVDIAPDAPPINAKELKLTMVILNMLNNSRQATGEGFGKGDITIKAEKTVAGGKPYLMLLIQDTGTGIDKNDQKIGTLGYTTKPHGTGFGVAGSKMTLREFEGTLTLRNRTDGVRGAEAEIIIPAAA